MKLTKSELMELQQQASMSNGRADSVRHARLILLLSEGPDVGRDSREARAQRQLHRSLE